MEPRFRQFDTEGRLRVVHADKVILAKSPKIEAKKLKPPQVQRKLKLFTTGGNIGTTKTKARVKTSFEQWIDLGGKIKTNAEWRKELSKPTAPSDWVTLRGIAWIGNGKLKLALHTKRWDGLKLQQLADKVNAERMRSFVAI